jgi:SAM-dependent methyltransferase
MGAEQETRRLLAASLAAGDATGFFEKLYAAAEQGTAEVPWDRPDATPLLVEWARPPDGEARRALVVGCGLGRDAEFLARLGWATTAFDISRTAVRVARERHPASPVRYEVADLLDPPPGWRQAFDLVVESNNVQALPRDLRAGAIASVGALVAPGGTLLVLAAQAAPGADDGPPWPLTRDEMDAFAAGGLTAVSVDEIAVPDDVSVRRWRGVYHRG